MTTFTAELEEAVAQLEDNYDELKSAARRRLGELFNPADYSESLAGLFDVAWDFPSVEALDYLRQLNPEVSMLDGLLVDRPRRNILRRPRSGRP